jgi:hypothetical protein
VDPAESANNVYRDESKRISVSIMERIFNQNVASSINNWHFSTNPEKKLEAVFEEAKIA